MAAWFHEMINFMKPYFYDYMLTCFHANMLKTKQRNNPAPFALMDAVKLLADDQSLPPRYFDHALVQSLSVGFREDSTMTP